MAYSNHLSTFGKQSIDSVQSIANSAFAALEQTAALHLKTAQNLFDHGLSGVRALSEVKEPQELWSLGSKISQPGVQQAIAWSRGLYEITSRAQQEISQRGEALIGDFTKSLSELLDDVAKNAPTGSEPGIAAARTALSVTRSALDNISQTSRKVVEIASANVAAADAAISNASSPQSSRAASKAA